jgi:hypothetical protein
MKKYMYLFGMVCLLLLITACSTKVYENNTTNIVPAKGRVVMTVTDAAVNLGSVSSIKMTVDNIALHSDANGWIDVAAPKRTYDLVALKLSGNQALLADLSLLPARYDQMRLDISNVTVTDSNGTHNAKLPSGRLRLNGEIVVLENKIATVSFDFIADESLHTANGKYIFAPVIQLESRTNGNAEITQDDKVYLSGGAVQTRSRVGMDTLGNLVIGGKLPPFLKINNDGTISGTENEENKK